MTTHSKLCATFCISKTPSAFTLNQQWTVFALLCQHVGFPASDREHGTPAKAAQLCTHRRKCFSPRIIPQWKTFPYDPARADIVNPQPVLERKQVQEIAPELQDWCQSVKHHGWCPGLSGLLDTDQYIYQTIFPTITSTLTGFLYKFCQSKNHNFQTTSRESHVRISEIYLNLFN